MHITDFITWTTKMIKYSIFVLYGVKQEVMSE